MPARSGHLSVPLRPLPEASRLSAAEQSVLLAVARGWSNRQVAQQRSVSVHTIANQVASLFSKLGVQSRNDLALLLADVALPAPEWQPSSLARDQARPRVLVAEDYAPAREEIGRSLIARGYGVTDAASAAEASAELERGGFAVAVLDIDLGDASALTLLEQTGGVGCPVVLLSDVADLGEVVLGLLLGAREFVEKTAGLERMRLAVGDALASEASDSPGPTAVEQSEALAQLDPDEVVRGLRSGLLRFAGSIEHRGGRHAVFRAQVGRPLGPREDRILASALSGEPVKAIASTLSVSEAFAWSALGRAVTKLGFRDRVSAMLTLGPLADRWTT